MVAVMVVVCAEAVLGSRLALDSGIVEIAREIVREVVREVARGVARGVAREVARVENVE